MDLVHCLFGIALVVAVVVQFLLDLVAWACLSPQWRLRLSGPEWCMAKRLSRAALVGRAITIVALVVFGSAAPLTHGRTRFAFTAAIGVLAAGAALALILDVLVPRAGERIDLVVVAAVVACGAQMDVLLAGPQASFTPTTAGSWLVRALYAAAMAGMVVSALAAAWICAQRVGLLNLTTGALEIAAATACGSMLVSLAGASETVVTIGALPAALSMAAALAGTLLRRQKG